MDTRISLKFLGGVADGINLTGSCILLTVKQGKEVLKVLIDAGLIQCNPTTFNERNREILKYLDPRYIDFLVLTHAHNDHGGRIPLFVKNGFDRKSRIICTKPTNDILKIMLKDSFKIQSETFRSKVKELRKEKKLKNKKGYRRIKTLGKHDKIFSKNKEQRRATGKNEMLYDVSDIEKACSLIKNAGCEYREWIKLSNKVSLKLYESGHVLGGAICVVRIETKTRVIHLGFSGDLGRSDGIILPPPALIEESIDYWFTESTYGGQTHPSREDEVERLLEVVREAVRDRKKIIIPSFVLERAQEIIYILSRYMHEGIIPKIPIFLDSPMAIKITEVYSANWEKGMFSDQKKLPFNPFNKETSSFFNVISTKIDSSALISDPGPYIVVAGSGMCDAGRVRDHLRNGLDNPNVIVCIVGHMADSTLGNKLKRRLPLVLMNGKGIVVNAKIVCFDSFSAHADSSFLVNYAKSVVNKKNKKIFIVHGEEETSITLKLEFMKALKMSDAEVIIPELNQEFEIEL